MEECSLTKLMALSPHFDPWHENDGKRPVKRSPVVTGRLRISSDTQSKELIVQGRVRVAGPY
jgi:hypothetical protein